MKKINKLTECHGGAWAPSQTGFFGDESVIISGMPYTVPRKDRTLIECMGMIVGGCATGLMLSFVLKSS